MADFERMLQGMTEMEGVKLHEPFISRDNVTKAQALDLTDQDTIIASYPKSGVTWMQQIVSMIENGGAVAENPIHQIINTPFMEFRFPGRPSEAERIAQMPSPRILKTHLPARLLRDHVTKNGVKTIVVIRNPLDTLASVYDFYKTNSAINFQGSWDDFYRLAVDDQLLYGDALEWTQDWWGYRDQGNVYIVKYEDMKADLRGSIQGVAAFLQKDLSTDQLDRIAAANTLDAMRTRAEAMKSEPLPAACAERIKKMQQDMPTGSRPGPAMNPDMFMSMGEVGCWKKFFTDAQKKTIMERYDSVLVNQGITFTFEN